MKAKFSCANCLKETEFPVPGKASLVCQSCGCPDIKFNTNLLVSPEDYKTPGFTLVKADEPFLGQHKVGFIWQVKSPKEEKVPSLNKRANK